VQKSYNSDYVYQEECRAKPLAYVMTLNRLIFPLSERPIFHQIERRVETHIFLCVLAYHLLVAIENTLLDRGIHTSWWTVRQTLMTHQVCTIILPTDNGKVLNIRKASKPEPEIIELYKLLNIPLEIIQPKKFWSSIGDNSSD